MKRRPLSFEERRALVMSVVEDGRTQTETAELFGVSVSAVCRWTNAYREHGDDGLRDSALSARPAYVPMRVLTGSARVLVGAAVLAGVDATASVREAQEAIAAGRVGVAYNRLQAADGALMTLQESLRRMDVR